MQFASYFKQNTPKLLYYRQHSKDKTILLNCAHSTYFQTHIIYSSRVSTSFTVLWLTYTDLRVENLSRGFYHCVSFPVELLLCRTNGDNNVGSEW